MKKYSIIVVVVIIVIVVSLFFLIDWNSTTRTDQDTSLINKIQIKKESVLYPTQSRQAGMFDTIILQTSHPITELLELVGNTNVDRVLRINRIDRDNLKSGMTLIVPKNVDLTEWQYMPGKITAAKNIPKLVLVSQPTQAFGVYEHGVLVRSGPVSSGKKLNQTPSGLFFVNWKGEETVSTFNDEWVLKWNMNIDNLEGISLHQYSLPGFPASHSCVRLTEADAYWLYTWTDEWTLHNGDLTKEGTPVIIYGNYNFDTTPPWTLLAENPRSTDTPRSLLENVVKKYTPDIISRSQK
jgi:lipoprotein-anchoring transpeptidase ErfK/SrfK